MSISPSAVTCDFTDGFLPAACSTPCASRSTPTRLSAYRPDTEDWIWHVLLPFVAYALIAGGGVALLAAPAPALYAPAAGAALLIFIGIHNAWDVVTFLASGQAAAIPDEPGRELAVQRDE